MKHSKKIYVPDPISPYQLPAVVNERLLSLALQSDLLLIGEMHGTQEVPRLMLGLLPQLAAFGYGGLALEIPTDECDQLLQCTQGQAMLPPFFGPSDFHDGRENEQALSLIQQAVSGGWHLLCFDVVSVNEGDSWSVRDSGMAKNLLEQWELRCPGKKILGVCGNYHSRLTPHSNLSDFWPSFAYTIQQLRPDLTVSSVNVVFQRGAFFNGEIRQFDSGSDPLMAQAEIRPASGMGHTLDLYLPVATPVTFVEDTNNTNVHRNNADD